MNLLSKLQQVFGKRLSGIFRLSSAFQAHTILYAMAKNAATQGIFEKAFGKKWTEFTQKMPAVAEQLYPVLFEFHTSAKYKTVKAGFKKMSEKELEALRKILDIFPEVKQYMPEKILEGKKLSIILPENFVEEVLSPEEKRIFKQLQSAAPAKSTLKVLFASPQRFEQFKTAATASKMAEGWWILKEAGILPEIVEGTTRGEIPTRLAQLQDVLTERVLAPLFQTAKAGPEAWTAEELYNILATAAREFWGEEFPTAEATTKMARILGTLFAYDTLDEKMAIGAYLRQFATGIEAGVEPTETMMQEFQQRIFGLAQSPKLSQTTQSINLNAFFGAMTGVLFGNAQENIELEKIVKGLAGQIQQYQSASVGEIAKMLLQNKDLQRLNNLIAVRQPGTEWLAKNLLFSASAASFLPENLKLGAFAETAKLLPTNVLINFEDALKSTYYARYLENVSLTNIFKTVDAGSQAFTGLQLQNNELKRLIRGTQHLLASITGINLGSIEGAQDLYELAHLYKLQQLAQESGHLDAFESTFGFILRQESVKASANEINNQALKFLEYQTVQNRLQKAALEVTRGAGFDWNKLELKSIVAEATEQTQKIAAEPKINAADVISEHVEKEYLASLGRQNEQIIQTRQKIAENAAEQAPPPPPTQPPAEKAKRVAGEQIAEETINTEEVINQKQLNEQIQEEVEQTTIKSRATTSAPSTVGSVRELPEEIQSTAETLNDISSWVTRHKMALMLTGGAITGLITIGAVTRARHRQKLADMQAALYHSMRTNYAELQNFRPSPLMMTSYQYTPQEEGYHNGYEVYGIPQATYKSRQAF